jgi:nitrogen regulatory protein PII
MKLIVTMIKPFLAERVIQSLQGLELEEMIVREVKGFGRQKNYLERYRSNEYSHAFVAKVEISVWASNDLVEEVVDRINHASRTGRLGDGKILILPVTQI